MLEKTEGAIMNEHWQHLVPRHRTKTSKEQKYKTENENDEQHGPHQ